MRLQAGDTPYRWEVWASNGRGARRLERVNWVDEESATYGQFRVWPRTDELMVSNDEPVVDTIQADAVMIEPIHKMVYVVECAAEAPGPARAA